MRLVQTRIRSEKSWEGGMLAHGKWQAVRRVSLLLAVFFSLSAGLQYWFIKREVLSVVTANLRDGIESIRQAVNLRDGLNTESFDKADIIASNYFAVLKNGAIIDVESLFGGQMIPGVLPTVEAPFPLEPVFRQPTIVASEFGENWHLFGKPLDRGFVLIGISKHSALHDPDEKLVTNLGHFGSTLSDALKRSRDRSVLDNAVNYVVVDDSGNLLAAAGRIPLRTNPLLVGALPKGAFQTNASDATYVLLREPLTGRNGEEAGTVVSWADITPEQRVLNNQVRFGVGAAVVSWAMFLAFAAWYWSKAEAEKRQIREAFHKYFSPKIMEAILKDPGKLALGGQRREVTILFSDIRSFTKLTERLPPQQLTRLLQEYFTAMTEEVMATDGIVDKYIGDAIMAFWGAPIEQSDQADRAVRTAMNMVQRLKTLREQWQAEGYPVLDIGIGINLGVATVGNFGSAKRFDYTLLGDAVNAASRLEGLNKKFQSNIIISDSTKRQLTIDAKTQDLGPVTVEGREEPIRVHRVEV